MSPFLYFLKKTLPFILKAFFLQKYHFISRRFLQKNNPTYLSNKKSLFLENKYFQESKDFLYEYIYDLELNLISYLLNG